MPVLKVKNNGVWEEVFGGSSNESMSGGNADTLDGKHADEFALVDSVSGLQTDVNELQTDVSGLQEKVGDKSVSVQIDAAISKLPTNKTLVEHLAEESMVLTSLQYGDELPTSGTAGRIFFKKVQ